jgi:hypothetical protein
MIDQANTQLPIAEEQSFDKSPVLNLEIIREPQRATQMFGQARFEGPHFGTRQPLHLESFTSLPLVTAAQLGFLCFR